MFVIFLLLIQKLLDMGLIEQVKVGREIKYKDALSKKSINDMPSWGNDGIKNGLDRWEAQFYEFFSHPYHV